MLWCDNTSVAACCDSLMMSRRCVRVSLSASRFKALLRSMPTSASTCVPASERFAAADCNSCSRAIHFAVAGGILRTALEYSAFRCLSAC